MVNYDPIAVFVSPPDRDRYERYTEYLQDVVHFIEFLKRHPECGNSQFRKDANKDKVPVKRSFVRQHTFDEGTDSSDGFSDVMTPVTTVAPPREVAVPPLASKEPVLPRGFVDKAEALRIISKNGLLNAKEREALANPVGTSGSVQVGKKATKARLKKYCSDNLVEELIEKNRISRLEEHLSAVEKQMAHAYARVGRKLIKADLRKPEKLVTKPDPPPGQATYVDYAALWESSEASSE